MKSKADLAPPQAGLAESLRELDAGTEALAAEHRQCSKAAAYAPQPADGTAAAVTDSVPAAAGASAPETQQQQQQQQQPPPAAVPTASAATSPRRLDFLAVCAEAPEPVQHPLIAAEEVSRGNP